MKILFDYILPILFSLILLLFLISFALFVFTFILQDLSTIDFSFLSFK